MDQFATNLKLSDIIEQSLSGEPRADVIDFIRGIQSEDGRSKDLLAKLTFGSLASEPKFGAGTKDKQILLQAFGFGNQGETDSAREYLRSFHGSGTLFGEAQEVYNQIGKRFTPEKLRDAIAASKLRLENTLQLLESKYGGILKELFNMEGGQFIGDIRQKIKPKEFEQLALLKQLSDDLVDRKTTKN